MGKSVKRRQVQMRGSTLTLCVKATLILKETVPPSLQLSNSLSCQLHGEPGWGVDLKR